MVALTVLVGGMKVFTIETLQPLESSTLLWIKHVASQELSAPCYEELDEGTMIWIELFIDEKRFTTLSGLVNNRRELLLISISALMSSIAE